MSTLETERDTLYSRLEAGYVKIERGLTEGKDITEWEDLWLQLLNEYEQVCNEIQNFVPEQRELFGGGVGRRWQ